MAQEREFSREAFPPGAGSGPGYTLAQRISRVFHPIILNMVMFLIVGYYAFDTATIGLPWAGLCVLMQVVPTTLFYVIRMRQGMYSDEDVSVRQQRNELYLFGLVTVLVGTAILVPLGLPRAMLALLISAIALGVVGGLVNMFWKISVHGASIAATAMVALHYARWLGVIVWLCALLVGWARVRTRNHTPLQVLAGFCAAALIVGSVFALLQV